MPNLKTLSTEIWIKQCQQKFVLCWPICEDRQPSHELGLIFALLMKSVISNYQIDQIMSNIFIWVAEEAEQSPNLVLNKIEWAEWVQRRKNIMDWTKNDPLSIDTCFCFANDNPLQQTVFRFSSCVMVSFNTVTRHVLYSFDGVWGNFLHGNLQESKKCAFMWVVWLLDLVVPNYPSLT